MDELDIPPPARGASRPGLYRVSRSRHGFDPSLRRLLIGAGGLTAVVLAASAGWHMTRHAPAVVPVIEADRTPIKVRPDNPGGLQVAGQDDAILSGQADGRAEALAPAPETPAPLALKAQEAAQRPVVATPPAVAQTISLPAPVTIAPAKPLPVSAAAERPAASHPAEGKPAQVQLAAMQTEDAAKAEWQRLAKRMPDLIAKRHPAVIRADVDGRTVYRLRTGGFADVAQAAAFCAQVRAKGGGCSLATF